MTSLRVKKGYATHCVIICHGKSEYLFFTTIKRILKTPIEIDGDKNGGKSVQIRSIPHFLQRQDYKDFPSFTRKGAVGQYACVNHRALSSDFKIFFVMDLDDCPENEGSAFIDKSMFQKHWSYPHVMPIYCHPNIEAVFEELGYFPTTRNKTEYYTSLFSKILVCREDVEKLGRSLEPCQTTNLAVLIGFLLRHS